ncbi:non-specific lipid transfer protein GPI-anchored 7-like [Actinidia eriantha]|uniref:non-specific lipid transfer protein GPI-anchored 7-like n=1 Tax=Actinidia eriantha TaxID=165200 RepID=UPI00258423B9|nr:non-specific lipid transfer protein GPI-anchored 7-like [Actinidia eriantha]
MDFSKILALAMVAAVVLVAEGQPTPSCAEQLVPCVSFINATGTPPATCCDPLKEAVTQQMQCLCNLYNTPGFLKSVGIDVNQALLLPGRCNIAGGDLSSCVKASAPSSPSTEPPPATPGNGAGRFSWIGMPSMILFSVFMMLC